MGKVLALQAHEDLIFDPQDLHKTLSTAAGICHPNTRDTETEEDPKLAGQPV